jgi:hypothetical protein
MPVAAAARLRCHGAVTGYPVPCGASLRWPDHPSAIGAQDHVADFVHPSGLHRFHDAARQYDHAMSLRETFSFWAAGGLMLSVETHGWICWVGLTVAFVALMGVMHPQTMQRWADRLRGRPSLPAERTDDAKSKVNRIEARRHPVQRPKN